MKKKPKDTVEVNKWTITLVAEETTDIDLVGGTIERASTTLRRVGVVFVDGPTTVRVEV